MPKRLNSWDREHGPAAHTCFDHRRLLAEEALAVVAFAVSLALGNWLSCEFFGFGLIPDGSDRGASTCWVDLFFSEDVLVCNQRSDPNKLGK